MSASERKAYNQQAADCSQKVSSKFASLQTLGGPLQNQWFDIVEQIDQTKAVRKGIKKFSSCAAKSGVDVTGINSFFQYMDKQMNESGRSNAVGLHLAGIYATCLTPIETVRDSLREQARKNFFASNAEQIKQLTNQVNSIVKVLGDEYHIKWRTN
jgi:aspartyl aminopeptidase